MNDQTLVLRKPGLIEAEVDGEIVALHVDNGTCYGFNSTASIVWRMIEQPMTFADVRDALLRDFEVEPDVCAAQLTDLLGELERDGLIELRPDGAAAAR